MLIIGVNLNAQTYNPLKAAEYASYWCDCRNVKSSPKFDDKKWGGPYINYGATGLEPQNLGGDCANFVSQCLIYGGLNLSAGTNGNGNGVKPEGTITGVQNLIIHLTKYQNTNVDTVYGYNPSINHDIGDPMFEMGKTASASHSQICSSLDSDADRLYSMHSNDHCDVYTKAWYDDWDRNIFFHIKSTYPDHCYDCDKNHGEKEINCGGPCPPCDRAPEYKNITTATSNLPSEVRAIRKITAGNAAVKVLNGQDVTFITAGSIDLLPGFEVQAGAKFNTVHKGSILGVTNDCGDFFCWPKYYFRFLRWRDHYTFDDVTNIGRIYYEIIIHRPGINEPAGILHSETVYVTKDGRVELWDLVSGVPNSHLKPGRNHKYEIYMDIYSCKGHFVGRQWQIFTVANSDSWKNQSSNEDSESEETENPITFSSPNFNNIIHQDENVTQTFSIIPNPNPGTFQIESNFSLTDIGNLKVLNSLGTTIYETQDLSSNTIQLPTSASGTFFVVIILKDGAVLTQKMVVRR